MIDHDYIARRAHIAESIAYVSHKQVDEMLAAIAAVLDSSRPDRDEVARDLADRIDEVRSDMVVFVRDAADCIIAELNRAGGAL